MSNPSLSPTHFLFLFLSPDVKPNYLKGLSHVLNRLPKPVLLPELPTVSPADTLSKGEGCSHGYSW
jgi:hypothetical protein